MRGKLKLPQLSVCPFFVKTYIELPKLSQGDFCAIYFNLIDKINDKEWSMCKILFSFIFWFGSRRSYGPLTVIKLCL